MMTDQIYQLLQGSGRGGGNQGPRGDQGGVGPNSLLPMGTQSQGMGGLSDILRRQTAYRGFDLGMLLQLLNSIIGGDEGGGGGGGGGGNNGGGNTGGGGTGCLCGDVLVKMADGSEKRADQIQVDDIVMGYDPAIGDVPQAVHTVQSSRQPCALISFEDADGDNEYDIEASLTHNWFTKDGNVVPTVKLEEGMELWGEDGVTMKIISIEPTESQVVYWWNVTPNGNYYAGGVLHHNASSTSITKNPGYTPSSYLGYTPIGGGGEPL